MNRRRFLTFAGAAGLLPATGARPVLAAARVTGLEPSTPTTPSVGYAPEPGARFRDAATLLAGQPALAGRGLKLGVLGIAAGRLVPGAPRHTVALDVSYLPFHSTPFRAWAHTMAPVSRTSSPIGLHVPLDPGTGLNLGIVLDEQTTEESLASVRLTAGAERTVPKLQPGYYAVPLLRGRAGRLVDWPSLTLAARGGGALTVAGPGELPVSLLLFSVARA